ncbi:hypothetical protein BGZ83_000894 [Gryganskiella cystojenkinii]|nr:hypothetical protein BGZ83_000894 [Gryganskiella cystojenkinii]
MTRRTTYIAIFAAIAMIMATTNAYPVQGPGHVEARISEQSVPGKINRGTPRSLHEDVEARISEQSVPGKINRGTPRSLHEDVEARISEQSVPGKINRGTPRSLQEQDDVKALYIGKEILSVPGKINGGTPLAL